MSLDWEEMACWKLRFMKRHKKIGENGDLWRTMTIVSSNKASFHPRRYWNLSFYHWTFIFAQDMYCSGMIGGSSIQEMRHQFFRLKSGAHHCHGRTSANSRRVPEKLAPLHHSGAVVKDTVKYCSFLPLTDLFSRVLRPMSLWKSTPQRSYMLHNDTKRGQCMQKWWNHSLKTLSCPSIHQPWPWRD